MRISQNRKSKKWAAVRTRFHCGGVWVLFSKKGDDALRTKSAREAAPSLGALRGRLQETAPASPSSPYKKKEREKREEKSSPCFHLLTPKQLQLRRHSETNFPGSKQRHPPARIRGHQVLQNPVFLGHVQVIWEQTNQL